MPRLSLWRTNHSNDYKFFDRRISEMFTMGGTDINVHKYLGTISPTTSTDATIPAYANQSEKNIQDLLFLENRDRKYDTSVYTIRGIYRINDNDFDLSQFGLFLTSDTLFIVFHLNDMVEHLGRKIIVGDVIELPHLKDYYPLDDDLPAALKRYYVVQDATRAAEGFSPTWWGHLWRVKVQPLVDSQEYKDILNNIAAGDNTTNTLGDLLSTYNKYLNINDAVITQAERNVPESGYDTSSIYIEPEKENLYPGSVFPHDASDVVIDASDESDGGRDASSVVTTPSATVKGYLTGDGLTPNGLPVQSGISFPFTPQMGDYFLRLDYIPNRLFRFDGKRWVKIEDSVRTSLTPGSENKTLRSSFVNNDQKTMTKRLAYDAIRCKTPYIPIANCATSSFNLTTKSVITKIAYVTTDGVETLLNGFHIENTMSNISGNIGFTITSNVSVITGDLLEYTIYRNVVNERQSLSNALRPQADN
jgi:hypothetical protein